MRIGVNLFALTLNGGGMRQYVLQLLPGLVRQSDHTFIVFFGNHGHSSLALILRQLNRNERRRFETVEISTPEEIYAHSTEFDLLFCPLNNFAPDLTDRPTVGTLADVQEHFYPEYFTSEQRASRAICYGRMARAVTRLITLSEFSKESICRVFDVPREKVCVAHLAPNELMRQAQPRWPSTMPRLPGRFVVYPANLYPHKNHEGLLRSIAILRDRGIDCGAVCTGQAATPGTDIAERIAAHGLGDRVLWLGHIAPEALRYLYSQAIALDFPSQFEGFGMPLVEAMMCGCPVIASSVTSIPEVVGDAGMLVDATPEAHADAIERILRDDDLRQQMMGRGLLRAREFELTKLVERTLKILDEAADAHDQCPAVREPISFVVRCRDGTSLPSTLASLAMEIHDHDEVIVVGNLSGLGAARQSVTDNFPNLRVVEPGDRPVDWLRETCGALLCILEEGDRLCRGASDSVRIEAQTSSDRAAFIGEVLSITRTGQLLGNRFIPPAQPHGRHCPPVPLCAIFWRRGFLRDHDALLNLPRWGCELLVKAGDRTRILHRALALMQTPAERIGGATAVRPVGGPLRRMARQLPAPCKRFIRQLLRLRFVFRIAGSRGAHG